MWDQLNKLKETIIDIIFPRNCLGCGKEGKYICEKCDLFLSETPSLFSQGSLEELVSIWEYEGLIKEIILKIKYYGAFEAINELVEKAFKIRKPYIPENTVITFVPMFKKKEKRRGFNQAEIIAKKVGEMTGSNVLSLLEKIKDTPSQTKLDKEERLKNIMGSFKRKEGIICNSNVLLVDDVWTSGATMKECARVLKKSGVKRIFGFTLARTV